MQFGKKSYRITGIITQTQEEVPNNKASLSPGWVPFQHIPRFRRQQRDTVKSGCPKTGNQQQQFCWVGARGKDWLQLLSTKAGPAQGAERPKHFLLRAPSLRCWPQQRGPSRRVKPQVCECARRLLLRAPGRAQPLRPAPTGQSLRALERLATAAGRYTNEQKEGAFSQQHTSSPRLTC